MRYVTTAMIAKHAGRHPESVTRALLRTGTPIERPRGVKGIRILRKDADKFLALQWPEAGPMRIEEVASR